MVCHGRRLGKLRFLLTPQPHDLPTPWLGPVGARRTACSPAGRRASPGVGQPWLVPPATAPHHPQGHLDPNFGRKWTQGDSLTPLPTFPNRHRRRITGISASAAALHAPRATLQALEKFQGVLREPGAWVWIWKTFQGPARKIDSQIVKCVLLIL
jgi:hypothetical protein